mmetsp:Transcript_145/g.88  ORF Transcript_145/g.88 Transcript_145/m.88 type:complete len:81 (+) Transcript_145:107-349(+)
MLDTPSVIAHSPFTNFLRAAFFSFSSSASFSSFRRNFMYSALRCRFCTLLVGNWSTFLMCTWMNLFFSSMKTCGMVLGTQ